METLNFPIVIIQTIVFTSGLFTGTKTKRYITVYPKKQREKTLLQSFVAADFGSNYKILSQVVK